MEVSSTEQLKLTSVNSCETRYCKLSGENDSRSEPSILDDVVRSTEGLRWSGIKRRG